MNEYRKRSNIDASDDRGKMLVRYDCTNRNNSGLASVSWTFLSDTALLTIGLVKDFVANDLTVDAKS